MADDKLTKWEYARLDYRAAGTLGTDRAQDWIATFHYPGGSKNWGQDERFDDLKHLNRAGAAGWEAYHRATTLDPKEGFRQVRIIYSLRRPL